MRKNLSQPISQTVGGARATSPEDSAVIQRRVRAELSFPPNQPAIASAWLADDGGVWLRRRSGAAGTNAPRWIVLDAEARPRGAVTLPAGARVVWSRGERAWVVEADEMGVPWLVRYRLAG